MNLHVVSEKDRKAGLWQGYSGTTCVPDCTHLVIASCTSEEAFFSCFAICVQATDYYNYIEFDLRYLLNLS